MNKGFFISLEGMDGSGKSTLGLRLVDHLRTNMGLEVVVVREPGGTTIGEQVRSVLHSTDNMGMSQWTEAYLYQASRAQICEEVIQPALNDGKVVIVDRFGDSSTVYQGYSRGLGAYEIDRLNTLSTGGLIPDLTLLLDLDPTTGLARTKGREEVNRMDLQPDSFYHRVRGAYLTLYQTDIEGRWELIDADQDPDVVFETARNIVEERMYSAGLIERQRHGKES